MTTSASSSSWFIWALLSAVFAALTAIFAKVGLAGVNSDMATLIRTVVIFGVLGAFVSATGKWANPLELSSKTWLFLVLSGLATGASWTCYFRALKVGQRHSLHQAAIGGWAAVGGNIKLGLRAFVWVIFGVLRLAGACK